MCDKSVNKCSLAFIYFPDQHKTQEMYDRNVSKDTFSKFHRPDRIELKECVMKLLMIVPQH